jgi:hypothetical protein
MFHVKLFEAEHGLRRRTTRSPERRLVRDFDTSASAGSGCPSKLW